MSVKPRTIDQLGIETSRDYANNQTKLDPKLIEESRFIPLKTEVSVVRPYLPTELAEYLLPHPGSLWAAFEPPPDFYAYNKPLFSYQLIPSLGGYEKQESDTDKLEALEDSLSKSFKDRKGDQGAQQEEEKERKTLLGLMKTIERLDRTLTLINSKRNQYQRG